VLEEAEGPVEQVVEPSGGKAGGTLVDGHPSWLHTSRESYQVVAANLDPIPVSISNVISDVVQIFGIIGF